MPAGLLLTSSALKRNHGQWYKSKRVQRASITALVVIVFYIVVILPRYPSTFLSASSHHLTNNDASCSVQTPSTSIHETAPLNPNRLAKPKAAFVVLIRDRQLGELLPSIRDIQWAFNDDPDHCYDYIFLSETIFTDWFKDHMNDFLSKRPCPPEASYGHISEEDWEVPKHVDLDEAHRRWKIKYSSGTPYGKSITYRQMCRYQSGPIYNHPLVKNLEYLWRLEPETRHLCTYNSHWKEADGKKYWIERDPFRYMKANKKKYAWVMTMTEFKSTVMSLMARTHQWISTHEEMIASNNSLSFISDDGRGYNLCHFWSNFEIIDLSFVRSKAYQSYFEALDGFGGFFMERWGDAPVRSIAASLMLDKSEIWQINYAGYFHPPNSHCPRKLDPGQSCACDPQMNVEYGLGFTKCRSKIDELNGVDTRSVIKAINKENGVKEMFKDGQEFHVVAPARLSTSPILNIM